jgi:hypothetical protein
MARGKDMKKGKKKEGGREGGGTYSELLPPHLLLEGGGVLLEHARLGLQVLCVCVCLFSTIDNEKEKGGEQK